MTLQNLPTPMEFPTILPVNPALSYWILDGDGDICGFVVDVPVSGTLTQVAFGTSTVTTGDATFGVRLETVSATDGKPTGTLYAANSEGTVAIADADDNKVIVCNINSGTGVSVTKNDLIAVRFQRTASGSGNLRITNFQDYSERPYGFDDLSEGTYTLREGNMPVMEFHIGGWVLPRGCMIAGNSLSEVIDNNGTPEQRGSIIYVPFSCRVVGCKVILYTVAGSSFYVKLYSDPTGTPTEIASTALIDTDQISNDAAWRWIHLNFVTPVTLSINTKYALVLSPGDAGDLNSYPVYCGVNTLKSCYPGGQYGVYCSRDDTNAFAEDDTKWFFGAVLIDQLDDGAGAASGGGPVMGGMVLGR